MSKTESNNQYASLFESITGETTITEPQQTEIPVRLDEYAEEQSISTFVTVTSKNDGLADAIEQPETK